MTIQTPNIYSYRDEFCWSPDVGDEEIIDRSIFPIGPSICCTACYRGFIALFEIDRERGLVLKELNGFDREAPIEGECRIVAWDEITSQPDMQGVPWGYRYTLNKRISWSGKMRLVKLRSRDLVAECGFDNGKLVEAKDLSRTTLDGYRPPIVVETDVKEAKRVIEKSSTCCPSCSRQVLPCIIMKRRD